MLLSRGLGRLMNTRRLFSTATTASEGYMPVKKGRTLIVVWLGVYTTAFFFSVAGGAYGRLSRGEKSLKKWRPSKYGVTKIPKTDEQWEELRQEYVNSTEGRLSNPGIQMPQMKQLFYAKTFGGLPGIFTLPLFYPPMLYFLARGYFGKPLRKIMLVSLGVSAVNIAIALNLNNSVNRKESTDQDYHISQNYVEAFAPHLLGNAMLYGIGAWAFMTALRAHPDKGYLTIEQAIGAMKYRRLLHRTSLTLALTLFTGYIIGVNGGGLASNTFPKLTTGYFPSWDTNLSTGLNFYYNKGLTHFNHRTLGLLFGSAAILIGANGLRLPLPLVAKLGAAMIAVTSTAQIALGFQSLKKSVPWDIGMEHAACALLVLTAFLVAMHGVRRPSKARLQELLKEYAAKHGEEATREFLGKKSNKRFVARNKWVKDFKY